MFYLVVCEYWFYVAQAVFHRSSEVSLTVILGQGHYGPQNRKQSIFGHGKIIKNIHLHDCIQFLNSFTGDLLIL